MAIRKERLTNVSPGEVYDKLKEGIIFAGVEKKDGSVSYRGMTTVPELLDTLFKSRVSNEDKGKQRKAHWSDGMSDEEKKSAYVNGEKPLYVYDAIRSGFKGISVYLGNIVLDDKIGDLENLVYIRKEDVLDDPSFKDLQEGKLDVRDFLSGNSENKREEVSWDKKKELLQKLEEGVYFGTFRKKNGEPRRMVMTRNQEIIDEFSGEGAYEAEFKVEEESDEYLEIITSGVFPVYDMEKGEPRKYTIDSAVKVGKYPVFKEVDVDEATKFSIGDISLDELVFGTRRKKQEERKNLQGTDRRADLIADMGSSSTWDATWQHRMTKIKYMLEKELPQEFKDIGKDATNVGLEVKSHLNNKVIEVKLGKGDGLVYLLISPKGIYDVKNHCFEFKTNPGRGKDSNKGGLKEQRERMFLQRNVLGLNKALLINYLLKAMDRRKKANTIKYIDGKFFSKPTH